MKRLTVTALICLNWTLVGLASTIVSRVSVRNLVFESQRIFLGTCMSAESMRDERGIPSTVYTFEVSRSVKGRAPRQLHIKQFGLINPLPDGSILRVAGLPAYRVGETYLLFLTKESRLGFTSPKGLSQGVFRTYRDPATRRLAIAGGPLQRQRVQELRRELGKLGIPTRRQSIGNANGALLIDDFMELISKLLNTK